MMGRGYVNRHQEAIYRWVEVVNKHIGTPEKEFWRVLERPGPGRLTCPP